MERKRNPGLTLPPIRRSRVSPCSTRATALAGPSGQLVEAFAKALQAHREADALLGRLEDDEGRGLAGAHLLDQLVFHDHFGDAAIGQAAHEAGAADIVVVDLQAQPRWQQDAER